MDRCDSVGIALCGVMNMAATESEVGRFDILYAESIYVKNDAGKKLVY